MKVTVGVKIMLSGIARASARVSGNGMARPSDTSRGTSWRGWLRIKTRVRRVR